MSFFKKLFSTNYFDDEPEKQQMEDVIRFPLLSIFLNKKMDTLPNACGAFGVSITNPIPVNGVCTSPSLVDTPKG